MAPGLQGEITDAYTGRIADSILLPAFRQGQYDAGFIHAFEAYSTRLTSLRDAPTETQSESAGIPGWLIVSGIVGLLALLIIFGKPSPGASRSGSLTRVKSSSRMAMAGEVALNILLAILSSSGGSRGGSGGGSGDNDGGGVDFGGGDFDGGGSSRDW